MLKKKLLLISLFTILLIAIFHYFAIKYSWYWTYRWLDIPVHVVGGFWVAVTTLWVCLKIKHIDNIFGYKKKALIVMLGSVLIVGIFWELFELIFKITNLHIVGYWSDSLSDISNGVVGGFFAFLYFIRKKSAKKAIIVKHDNHLTVPLTN